MSLALTGLDATAYILPADGAEAERDFLGLLRNPDETFGADYGFALPDLIAEIETADAAGIAQHWILDRLQSTGSTEHPMLVAMLARLRNGDVTISTAGPDSRSPSQIMHDKVMVVRASDGGPPWCWLGSVNFSRSGWLEANTALLFRSQPFADAFIAWFERTRDWARLHIPQLTPVLPPGVALVPAVAAVVETVPHIAEGAPV